MDPKRVERLRWLAGLRVEKAAKQLAEHQQRIAQTRQQIDDFQQFKAMSEAPLREQRTLTVTDLKARQNRLGFLKKLESAIEASERKLDTQENDKVRAQQLWQAQRQKEQGFEHLVERAQHDEDVRETRAADKAAAEQWNLTKPR